MRWPDTAWIYFEVDPCPAKRRSAAFRSRAQRIQAQGRPPWPRRASTSKAFQASSGALPYHLSGRCHLLAPKYRTRIANVYRQGLCSVTAWHRVRELTFPADHAYEPSGRQLNRSFRDLHHRHWRSFAYCGARDGGGQPIAKGSLKMRKFILVGITVLWRASQPRTSTATHAAPRHLPIPKASAQCPALIYFLLCCIRSSLCSDREQRGSAVSSDGGTSSW